MNDQEKNLQKLEQLLKLVESGVSKEEFLKSFENVIALVLRIEKKNTQVVDNLEKTYQNIISKMQNDHTSTLADLKKQVNELFVGDKVAEMQTKHEQMMNMVVRKLASVKDGKDSVIPGPKGDTGSSGSPDMGIDIKYKLETLKGNDRLDVKAIKGLEEKLTEQRKGLTVYGPGKTRILLIDLSSQLNGALKTFILGTHFGIIGVWSSSSPFPFRPTVDYTEVGKTIVFDAAIDASVSLRSGDTLIVQVIR